MLSNWTKVSLNDVVERFIDYRGKTPPKVASGIPLVTAKIVKNGKIEEPNEFIAEKDYDTWMTKGLPEYGDVVITTEAPMGKVAQLKFEDKIALAQRIITLRGKKYILDNNFLRYSLQSNEVQNQLFLQTTGTTVQGIKGSELKKIEVLLPTYYEQVRIATILSSVDKAIEKTETIIEQTNVVKKGLMQQLFTKGIRHTNFKKTGIGEIPEGWEVKPLEDFCEHVTYGFTNPMPTTEDGPFMITAKDVKGGKIQYKTARKTDIQMYKNALTPKSKPLIGDILITKDGSLGRLAIVDRKGICINQSVATIRLKQDVNLINKYLFYLLASPKIQQRILNDAGGSTIKHIYITKLAKMEVPIPRELDEQNNIVILMDLFEGKLEREQRKLNQLMAIKKGLMQSLLTGKVRVKVDGAEVKQV